MKPGNNNYFKSHWKSVASLSILQQCSGEKRGKMNGARSKKN